MKNAFTKFVYAALAASLCTVAFASCGGTKNYAENNTQFFIGGTGPLTGDASSYGISVKNGATIAIEEINAAGGLNGYTFKFEMKDDTALETPAANAYTALFESGMQASIGSVTSGSCQAFANEAAKDNMFFISPSASSASVIAGDNAYRICFGDPDQGTISAETLSASYTKIGVIYDNADNYSNGIYEAFSAQMAAEHSDVQVVAKTFGSNGVDFSQQVSDLKGAGCEVIYLPIYYNEANLIIREAVDKQNWQPDFFGCDGLDGLKALLVEGDFLEKVEGKISYMTPFSAEATDPKRQAFVAAYEEKYGVTPDQFAADGYDAIYVIFEAMKKADVKDVTIAPGDLCEILKSTISSKDFVFTGATGVTTWDESGAPTKVPLTVELS